MRLFFMLPLSALMLSAAVVDIRTRRIPNVIVIVGLAFALASCVIAALIYRDMWLVIHCGGGIIAGGLPLFIVALASKGGMGMGDVKFLAMIGAFLGPRCAIEALFAAILAGGLYGVFLIVLKKKSLKTAFAFGPFLAFGGFCVLFFDRQIHEILAVIYHIPI